MKTSSILCLLDTQTGDITEIKRFDCLIEAPFFRGERELLYNEGGRIFRLFMDSGEIEEIPTGECNHCNNDHVLSPDGTMLAISHSPESDWQSRIYIVGLEPQTPPRLVTPIGPSYLHGWSPDGTTLAYCACRDGEYDVYTIPADGGEETRLTDVPGLDDGPEYAPDGRYIWFNSVRTGLMECFRMDTDGAIPSASQTTVGTTGSRISPRTELPLHTYPTIPPRYAPTIIPPTKTSRSAVSIPTEPMTVPW